MNEILIRHYHAVPCPLCGADKAKIRFPATNAAAQQTAQYFSCTNSYLAQHDDIVECQVCGMVYNNPQPDPAELRAVYQHVEDPRYIEEKQGRAYTFRKSLQQLHGFRQPPGKLLDVGCYTGAFMEIAAAAGWETAGCELSAWAAQIARQSGCGAVYEGDLGEIPLAPQSVAVITLWDVIEHLQNPAQILAQAAKLLKPGGILALSTHLLDSLPARILGTHYPFLMAMHLVHFSRPTLQRLLVAQGYEVLRILPHQRVIALTYFLEKLGRLFPVGQAMLHALQRHPWVQGRFITVRFSGLANIFAQIANVSACHLGRI